MYSPSRNHYNQSYRSSSPNNGRSSPSNNNNTAISGNRFQASHSHTRGFNVYAGQSLEALAVSEGILESPGASHILMQRLRESLREKGRDGNGFVELQRRLYVLDIDGSRTIGLEDFKVCLNSKLLMFDVLLSSLYL